MTEARPAPPAHPVLSCPVQGGRERGRHGVNEVGGIILCPGALTRLAVQEQVSAPLEAVPVPDPSHEAWVAESAKLSASGDVEVLAWGTRHRGHSPPPDSPTDTVCHFFTQKNRASVPLFLEQKQEFSPFPQKMWVPSKWPVCTLIFPSRGENTHCQCRIRAGLSLNGDSGSVFRAHPAGVLEETVAFASLVPPETAGPRCRAPARPPPPGPRVSSSRQALSRGEWGPARAPALSPSVPSVRTPRTCSATCAAPPCLCWAPGKRNG